MRFLYRLLAVALAVGVLSPLATTATAQGTTSGPATAAGNNLYRIVAGDQLDIKFFYQPELNAQVTVRPDGRLSLQLLDDVEAAGLTITELRDLLVTAYARELQQPKIAVILAGTGARVYVDGEVKRPGVVVYLRRMSILEAVSEAGGMKETAGTRQVLVIRPSVPGTSPTILEVDYDKALLGDAREMVDLHPSDIVFVPRSRISKVNRWVDQYLRQNIPIPLTLGWFPGN